ncbi:MAG: hypothetical protein GY742_13785 [Hyphomicrobiales bacterium]|nr:hypothetical protein [Hyphomicrobiales bacterium]
MKENDNQSIRRLIQYAKQESDKLGKPFVSYMLSIVLCELDSIDHHKTTNGVLTSSKLANGKSSLISNIDSD